MQLRKLSIPRGVCVIIERDDGKVLLHKRCHSAWIYPGRWAFFGGGVERGESPHAAIRRELLEELGYLLYGHRLFHVARHYKGGKYILDHSFVALWRPRQVRLREGEAMGWFEVDTALETLDLPPHERHDLGKLKHLRQQSGRLALAA